MYRIVFALLFFCAEKSGAQFYFSQDKYLEKKLTLSLGASGGIMNCITDLGGGKNMRHINWKNSKPAAGIFFSATYLNFLSLRLDFTFGQVTAADSLLKPIRSYVHGRYERNLSFKSSINEAALTFECYPAGNKSKHSSLAPYLLAGTGIFSFDPRASLDGQWYSLRPLHTEGQGFLQYPGRQIYKSMQVLFSCGAGLKYEAGKFFYIQGELNYRFLQTDYLDDVSTQYIDPKLFDINLPDKQAIIAKKLYKRIFSPAADAPVVDAQRGNPGRNDSYFTLMLRTGIVLGRKHL